jgi:hypothetical protein
MNRDQAQAYVAGVVDRVANDHWKMAAALAEEVVNHGLRVGFRVCSVADAEKLTDWLAANVAHAEPSAAAPLHRPRPMPEHKVNSRLDRQTDDGTASYLRIIRVEKQRIGGGARS